MALSTTHKREFNDRPSRQPGFAGFNLNAHFLYILFNTIPSCTTHDNTVMSSKLAFVCGWKCH